MARLFFALWPDARVRGDIEAVARDLPLQEARRVAASNTHLTLAFLGEVDAAICAALVDATDRLSCLPFALRLDRLGWWPKPKIAWLAPSTCPDELLQLAVALQELARDCGLSLDERPYRPHVTLARQVRAAPPPSAIEPIAWNIKEFCLLASATRDCRVAYQVKRSWPLKFM